jgi:hypothetical protein
MSGPLRLQTAFGVNPGFPFPAAVAPAAFGMLYCFMPETRDQQYSKPN